MSIEQLERMEEMELHEAIQITTGVEALRVPCGWLYIVYCTETGNALTSSFVPEALR